MPRLLALLLGLAPALAAGQAPTADDPVLESVRRFSRAPLGSPDRISAAKVLGDIQVARGKITPAQAVAALTDLQAREPAAGQVAEPPDHARLRADSAHVISGGTYDLGPRFYAMARDSRIVGDPANPPTITGDVSLLYAAWEPWKPDPAAWTADGGFLLNPLVGPAPPTDAAGNFTPAAVAPRHLFWTFGERLTLPGPMPKSWAALTKPLTLALTVRLERWGVANGDAVAIGGLFDPWGRPCPLGVKATPGRVRIDLADAAGVEVFSWPLPDGGAPGSKHALLLTIDPGAMTVNMVIDGTPAGLPRPFKGPLAANLDSAFAIGSTGFGAGSRDGSAQWPVTLYPGGYLQAEGQKIPIAAPAPGDYQCPGGGQVVIPGQDRHWALPTALISDVILKPRQAGAGLVMGTTGQEGWFTRVKVRGGYLGLSGTQAGANYDLHFDGFRSDDAQIASAYLCFPGAEFRSSTLMKPRRDRLLMRGGRVVWHGGQLASEGAEAAFRCLAYPERYTLTVRDAYVDDESLPPSAGYVVADSTRTPKGCRVDLDGVGFEKGVPLNLTGPAGIVTLRNCYSPTPGKAPSAVAAKAAAAGWTITGSFDGP